MLFLEIPSSLKEINAVVENVAAKKTFNKNINRDKKLSIK